MSENKIIVLDNTVWDNLFITEDSILFEISITEVLKYFHGLEHRTKNEFEIFDFGNFFKFKNDYGILIKREYEKK